MAYAFITGPLIIESIQYGDVSSYIELRNRSIQVGEVSFLWGHKLSFFAYY